MQGCGVRRFGVFFVFSVVFLHRGFLVTGSQRRRLIRADAVFDTWPTPEFLTDHQLQVVVVIKVS